MRAGSNSTAWEVSDRERFDNEMLSCPKESTGIELGDCQNL